MATSDSAVNLVPRVSAEEEAPDLVARLLRRRSYGGYTARQVRTHQVYACLAV